MSKQSTCAMSPDALHRRLKARSAIEHMSLSDYLPSEIKKIAASAHFVRNAGAHAAAD
jgi:hypothetical protein